MKDWKWVKCSDEMPKSGKTYLIYTSVGFRGTSYRSTRNFWVGNVLGDVTHWAEFPEDPIDGFKKK